MSVEHPSVEKHFQLVSASIACAISLCKHVSLRGSAYEKTCTRANSHGKKTREQQKTKGKRVSVCLFVRPRLLNLHMYPDSYLCWSHLFLVHVSMSASISVFMSVPCGRQWRTKACCYYEAAAPASMYEYGENIVCIMVSTCQYLTLALLLTDFKQNFFASFWQAV